jgi:hypothetical protein
MSDLNYLKKKKVRAQNTGSLYIFVTLFTWTHNQLGDLENLEAEDFASNRKFIW